MKFSRTCQLTVTPCIKRELVWHFGTMVTPLFSFSKKEEKPRNTYYTIVV